MVTERDFELLDDYLSNRMDAAEKASFEQKLQANPDLQTEHNLQQNLVSGLKKARMAELKTMLGNVPVSIPAKGGFSIGAKIGLTAVVAALVTTGIYFYVTETETPEAQPVAQTETPAADSNTAEEAVIDSNQPITEQPAEPEVEKPVATEPAEKPTNANPKHTPAKEPVIEPFDPSKEGTEEPAVSGEESAKAGKITNEARIPAEVVKSKTYTFHYQFKEGKLFLYGPFEDGLYEILEFFNDESGEQRTVFLYYEDKFYLLDQNDTRIKPLASITDPLLINKLKEYREK